MEQLVGQGRGHCVVQPAPGLGQFSPPDRNLCEQAAAARRGHRLDPIGPLEGLFEELACPVELARSKSQGALVTEDAC